MGKMITKWAQQSKPYPPATQFVMTLTFDLFTLTFNRLYPQTKISIFLPSMKKIGGKIGLLQDIHMKRDIAIFYIPRG